VKWRYSLRSLICFVVLCGAAVALVASLRPWYYKHKWESLGQDAIRDVHLLQTLLDMGPDGWQIATADTVSSDPMVRKCSGTYCLEGKFDWLDSNCEIFWRIWARRCMSDEKYFLKFCSLNRSVLPVIVTTHADTGLLKNDQDVFLSVYRKYRSYLLQTLDGDGVSPPCPRKILENARKIISDIPEDMPSSTLP